MQNFMSPSLLCSKDLLVATILVISFIVHSSNAFSSSHYLNSKIPVQKARQRKQISTTNTRYCASLCPSRHCALYAMELSFDGVLNVERTYQISDADEDTKKNEEEDVKVKELTTTTTPHEIRYHIHNRMNLSSQQAAPILVLHGGPGVPSDYLHTLTKVVPYRSIIFYDQLGCGRSMDGSPPVSDAYSIESSLDDLEALIAKIGVRKFHLYGQSFGGILAYEYIRRVVERESSGDDDGPKCLSMILSSTPCNVKQVEGVANDLITNLLEEDPDEATIMERFRINHQCRTEEKPQPLIDAYDHAGEQGIWRGTQSIQDWEAISSSQLSSSAKRMPSAMIMRGEYDFVTEDCILGWKDAFNHKFVRIKELEGCSHHGLLEKGNVYGEIVDSFFAEYD